VEKSKFSFKRGGQNVQGFTIQFARAIAECVGNITYSFKELSRTDKQSEMFVYAWDLETNTMQSRSFIVRHVRDKTVNYKNVATELESQRDIYENNANNAAKRIRECILGVLPTAARMKGQTIVESLKKEKYPVERMEEFIRNIVDKFKKLGVSRLQLIKERDNRPCEMWMRSDLSILNEHYDSIENETTTIYDIFDIKQKVVELVPKKEKKGSVHEFTKPFTKEEPKDQTIHKLNNEKAIPKKPGPEVITELRTLYKANSSVVAKALDDNPTFELQIKQALSNRNQTTAAELLQTFKKYINAGTLSVNVSQLKKASENPDYFHHFDRLADNGEFSKEDIKTIINNNDDSLAIKALDSIRKG